MLKIIGNKNKPRPVNLLIVTILVLLFPFFILSLPFYYIFTKISFFNIYKVLLSTLVVTLYSSLLVSFYIIKNPGTVKIVTPNIYLVNPQTPEKLLSPTNEKAVDTGDGLFYVTRVIDGDTIELANGQKVRYIGINAPEFVKTKECYGGQARQKNVQLVLNKKVRLEKDVSDKDRYDRLLRYVYVDKVFVNKTLVEEGFANSATYPPDVKFSDLFVTVQKEAQQKNKGLWKDCKN